MTRRKLLDLGVNSVDKSIVQSIVNGTPCLVHFLFTAKILSAMVYSSCQSSKKNSILLQYDSIKFGYVKCLS